MTFDLEAWRRLRRRSSLRRGLAKTTTTDDSYATVSREGGWLTLMGTDAVTPADDPWTSYTIAQKEALFKTSAIVHACIAVTYHAAAEAPPVIGKETKAGWKTDERHYLNKVFKQPNPDMSWTDFQSRVILSLLLTGISHIWEIRAQDGTIAEVWPLPTSWVETRRVGKKVTYYVFMGNAAAKMAVPPKDMTILKLPCPGGPKAYCSPLDAALRDYEVDSGREDYLREMLDAARPGLVVTTEDEHSPQELDAARAKIRDMIGKGRRGGILLLTGENVTADIVAPLKEIDWPGLSGLSETRMCAVFGVPPIIIHLRAGLEHATYSNYELALKAFYRLTIVPLWRYLSEGFTRGWVTNEAEDPDLEIVYDISEIVQLQEDRESMAKVASAIFNGGLGTRNEGRELAGMDAMDPEFGDVLRKPVNVEEVPVSEQARKRLELEEPEPEDEHEGEWDEAEGEGEEGDDEDEDAKGERTKSLTHYVGARRVRRLAN